MKNKNFNYIVLVGYRNYLFSSEVKANFFIFDSIAKEMKIRGFSRTYSLIDLTEKRQTLIKAFIREEVAEKHLNFCAKELKDKLLEGERMEQFSEKAGKHIIPGGYTITFSCLHIEEHI